MMISWFLNFLAVNVLSSKFSLLGEINIMSDWMELRSSVTLGNLCKFLKYVYLQSSHHITLYHTTLPYITPHHTTLPYLTPHYTTSHHITLHSTTSHRTTSQHSTSLLITTLPLHITLHSHCTHTAPLHITPLCITAHHHITPNQITPHHIQYAPLSLLILKNVFTWGCSSITFYINCNVFYSRLLPTLLTSTFFLNTRKIQEYQLTLLMAYTVRGRFKGPFTLRSI